MKIKQIELKQANKFVYDHHRHHIPVKNHRFSIGCFDDDILVGVAIVGRPVSRHLQAQGRIEINRLCTNGMKKNSASMLISRCARIAKELGYDIIQTYILKSETGTSLKASGWELEEDNVGGEWNSSKKIKRQNELTDLFGSKKKYPSEKKQRWIRKLNYS